MEHQSCLRTPSPYIVHTVSYSTSAPSAETSVLFSCQAVDEARRSELRQQLAARQAALAEVAKKQDVMRRRVAQLGEVSQESRTSAERRDSLT